MAWIADADSALRYFASGYERKWLDKLKGAAGDIPEGKDASGKLSRQATAYKDQLEMQLAALNEEVAGKKVLYEDDSLSAQGWLEGGFGNEMAESEAKANK